MGVAYADTSFLISLYGQDRYTASSRAAVIAANAPLLLCELNRLEFENALRLLRFRKLVAPRFMNEALAALQRDEQAGLLQASSCDWSAVFTLARQISARRTARGGHRTMDLLHVAAALAHPVRQFFSFDARQRTVAGQEGLDLNGGI